jgi:hypothetical protein
MMEAVLTTHPVVWHGHAVVPGTALRIEDPADLAHARQLVAAKLATPIAVEVTAGLWGAAALRAAGFNADGSERCGS